MAERELNLSLQDILTFPVSGFVWLLSEIGAMAERELFDDETVARKLIELQQAYELGEMDEETYRTAWEAYTGRLEEAMARRLDSSRAATTTAEEE